MLSLDTNLSDDAESTDSVASGAMTSRREKPVVSKSPLPKQRNRPKSAKPYGRGRYTLNANHGVHPNLLPPITSSPALGRTLPSLEDEEQPSPMMSKRIIQVQHSIEEESDDDENNLRPTTPRFDGTTNRDSVRYDSSGQALPPMFQNTMPSPIPRREALRPLPPTPKLNRPKKGKTNKNRVGSSEPPTSPVKERMVAEVKARPHPKPRFQHDVIKAKDAQPDDVEAAQKRKKVKVAVIIGYVGCALAIIGLTVAVVLLALDVV